MRGSNRVPNGKKREIIEEQALRLREYVIDAVLEKTGVKCPRTMTLDQLVRTAAANGIKLTFSTSTKQVET